MQIKLSQGKFTEVDKEDIELLSKYSWFYHSTGYAMTNIIYPDGKKAVVKMHKIFFDIPKGMCVDHINRDKLDNRRSNLRICSHAENMRNTGKRKNARGYKGVHFAKKENKWVAYITENYKRHHLGYFKDEKDAAKAYNEAAIKYFGKFAYINEI